MPLKELKRELDDIEVKQLELERQGVKLEQTIRLKFDETPQLNRKIYDFRFLYFWSLKLFARK